jgi:hypothetical protein
MDSVIPVKVDYEKKIYYGNKFFIWKNLKQTEADIEEKLAGTWQPGYRIRI